MPSPVTSNLPNPKSWDEFEDLCTDLLKRLWKDPYVVRYGRSGQKQLGVDIYGYPEHLGGSTSGKISGAQCKNTGRLEWKTIETEVEKAKGFKPPLSEYLVMTTAPRETQLLQDVKNRNWPFPVHIMFWEDISLELSGYDDLLHKHFPGWMRKNTTKVQVLDMILSARPENFDYDDRVGVFVYTDDLKLQIVMERGFESEREFNEPWVTKFPDRKGTCQPVYIYYGGTKVIDVPCVYVDGGRHIIPFPKSASDLTITPFCYHVGHILNHPIYGYGFDYALKCAGITVCDETA